MLLLALAKWKKFGASSKLLLTAWLLAFAAPFAVSAIPTRAYVCPLRVFLVASGLCPRSHCHAFVGAGRGWRGGDTMSCPSKPRAPATPSGGRRLMSWDKFDEQSEAFLTGFAQHFHLDKTKTQVLAACTEITNPNNVERLASVPGRPRPRPS